MEEWLMGMAGIIIIASGSYGAGWIVADAAAMQQAHERGFAVECVGQTGYHWECEK